MILESSCSHLHDIIFLTDIVFSTVLYCSPIRCSPVSMRWLSMTSELPLTASSMTRTTPWLPSVPLDNCLTISGSERDHSTCSKVKWGRGKDVTWRDLTWLDMILLFFSPYDHNMRAEQLCSEKTSEPSHLILSTLIYCDKICMVSLPSVRRWTPL